MSLSVSCQRAFLIATSRILASVWFWKGEPLFSSGQAIVRIAYHGLDHCVLDCHIKLIILTQEHNTRSELCKKMLKDRRTSCSNQQAESDYGLSPFQVPQSVLYPWYD